MKFKNQVICCFIIGCVACFCENCEKLYIHEGYENLKRTVFKEYELYEVKDKFIAACNCIGEIPEKVKNADEYLNEIIAAE